MKKILATAFPWKSDKKPPFVQTDFRGRLSSKVQQEKKQDSQHNVIDQPRHSSYTHSNVKDQNAALQRSRSTSSRGKAKT